MHTVVLSINSGKRTKLTNECCSNCLYKNARPILVATDATDVCYSDRDLVYVCFVRLVAMITPTSSARERDQEWR